MKKLTKKEIQKYEAIDELEQRLKDYQTAYKTTSIPDAYKLGLECIGYSCNDGGCTGHLYRDLETGELLGMPKRNNFIYIY